MDCARNCVNAPISEGTLATSALASPISGALIVQMVWFIAMSRNKRNARAMWVATLVACIACAPNTAKLGAAVRGDLNPALLPTRTDTMRVWRNPKRPTLHDGIPWNGGWSPPDRDGWVSEGERVVTVRRRANNGGEIIELIDDGRRATGRERSTVDAQFSATTLKPIRMHSEESDGGFATNFVFMDARVAELPSNRGLRDTVFNQYPDGAYSSWELDLVLRSLPLKEGYRVTLPLYYPFSYSRGAVPAEVDGRDSVPTRSGTTHQCWRIKTRLRGGTPEWFWVDTGSRELIRSVSQDDDGAVWVETR